MKTRFRQGLLWNGRDGFEAGDLWVEAGSFASPGAAGSEVDLQGGWVVPALWDSHLHLLLLARCLGQVDLSDCRNKSDLLKRLDAAEGAWVEGYGWNESHWLEPDLPRREELDRACGGRPCWLTRSDLHSAFTNSAGLKLAGISARTADPPGGRIERDASGTPTGLLADLAMLLIERLIGWPERERLSRLLRQACAQMHGYGIGGVCDQRITDLDDGPLAWSLYRELRLPLRIHCNRAAHEDLSSGPRFLEGDDWLRCGHVKLFADGSLGSRTARMLKPYLGGQERGLWVTRPDEMATQFARAHAFGFPVSLHAIGDEAVRAACTHLKGHPLDRIEHLQILNELDLQTLQPASPTASMQPLHLLDDRFQADQLLGERARGYYRLASLQARGVRLSFGSDAPVASFDPWLGLQAACLRRRSAAEEPWYPTECLDRAAALHAYTRGACESLGWLRAGRLEVGALADFCVIDRDPLTCPWPAEIKVLRTVLGGETYFSL
ncbi:MAG: amidohydrolase [Candidatus Eremiobacteraeota bacterium]|nr:amidohydrolase [Candidatus Eremiobacteraeota bacterium]MCW5868529.1 amidohydrolase [Candidatus Eremiobacteraeota bacterium]